MFFIRLLSRFPLPVLYLFSDCLTSFAAILDQAIRKKVIDSNLGNFAFPEKSAAERKKISQSILFENFTDAFLQRPIKAAYHFLKKRI